MNEAMVFWQTTRNSTLHPSTAHSVHSTATRPERLNALLRRPGKQLKIQSDGESELATVGLPGSASQAALRFSINRPGLLKLLH